jgi:hypothetical protein
MLAFSLDNLLFLLLIAVAALFQLLSKVVSKARKNESDETPDSSTQQTPRPIQRAPRESDADRIRKFLKALGQPPSSTPPPAVLPRTDIPPRRLAPVQPPPVIPGAWQLPRQRREKPDVTQRESAPLEQLSGLKQVVPPPVSPPAAPAFEVREALPVEFQQPQIITPQAEAYGAPMAFGVAKTADFKTDIGTLLASKSSLREIILLREILGTPRGLQALDATL